MPRTIMYYQTFSGLGPYKTQPCPLTHIHVAAVHFDALPTPRIHLNDDDPCSAGFDAMWADVQDLVSTYGVTAVLMVGGAGGAFQTLFSDFVTYYPMLRDLLRAKPFITGVDLDVEEPTDPAALRTLILALQDEGLFVTMAPLIGSLQADVPGMGGFCYKTLLADPAIRVAYLNAQAYNGSFTADDYSRAVANGYPAHLVVLGMMSGQPPLDEAVAVAQQLATQYPDFGGVFDWELSDAAPGWADRMKFTLK